MAHSSGGNYSPALSNKKEHPNEARIKFVRRESLAPDAEELTTYVSGIEESLELWQCLRNLFRAQKELIRSQRYGFRSSV